MKYFKNPLVMLIVGLLAIYLVWLLFFKKKAAVVTTKESSFDPNILIPGAGESGFTRKGKLEWVSRCEEGFIKCQQFLSDMDQAEPQIALN